MIPSDCSAAGAALVKSLSSSNDGVTPSLQRITQHCVRDFDCAVAVVSVLDATHQHFVARVGTELEGTPIGISFCRHATHKESPLLIADARIDNRFCDNALVVGKPYIRSYLGIPIKSPGGQFIGTICLIDPRPHRFDEAQIAHLELYAEGVEDLLKLHNQYENARRLTDALNEKNEQLSDANRIFRNAEQVAKIGAWELNAETFEMTWSAGIYAIYEIDAATALLVDDAISFYAESDQDLVRASVEAALTRQEPLEFDADLVSARGIVKRVRVQGEFVVGEGGQPSRLVGVFQDISDFYQSNLALRRAAERDSLTELYNRYAFDRLLRDRIDAARGALDQLWLLLIDLDGFKDVNDTLGHIVGDIVLEDVGHRIARAVPPESIAARWGGDEFAIVLPSGITRDEASTMGHQIISQICQRTEVSGQYIDLGATAGLVQGTPRVQAKELIRRADTALFYGKRRDPGKVHLYCAEIECENALRHRALHEVRGAIFENRLFAGYQPVVNLANRSIIGFEALMRLHTREGRRLTATEVFPALLDPLLSRDVSDCMLTLVAQEARRIEEYYPDFAFISINASEADLISDGFADRFRERMGQAGVDLSRLTLEVTETILLVNNAEPVQSVLTDLHNSGVQIALDDFGTGYSSLSHLRDFPIDKVKIDGSFVQSLASDHQSRTIVQALIGMAMNMDIEVIAEGIETEVQRTILQQMGCRFGQGFLFGAAQDISRLSLLALEKKAGAERRATAA